MSEGFVGGDPTRSDAFVRQVRFVWTRLDHEDVNVWDV